MVETTNVPSMSIVADLRPRLRIHEIHPRSEHYMPADRMLHKRAGQSTKVTGLSNLEYRVWTQYLLSADDYGVMRATAVALQADNDALAKCPSRQVQQAFDAVINTGLLHTFDHQGHIYVYQRDWQDFQKVTWPARTIQPAPTGDALKACTAMTRRLFATHPGGKKVPQKRDGTPDGSSGGNGAHSESTSEVLQEYSESTSEVLSSPRARVPAKRLTAKTNGLRLTADLREGVETPCAPLDVWLRDLQAQYPQGFISSGYLTEVAFVDVFHHDPRPPVDVFADILTHLENQKRGYQWAVKRMIPKLERWLREGLWKQLHDETPPLALISERTLHTELAGDAFVKGGANGR